MTGVAQPFDSQGGLIAQVMSFGFAGCPAFLARRGSHYNTPTNRLIKENASVEFLFVLAIGAVACCAYLMGILFSPSVLVSLSLCTLISALVFSPFASVFVALRTMFFLIRAHVGVFLFSVILVAGLALGQNLIAIPLIFFSVVLFLLFGVFEGHRSVS
jgi:hypothetical protein